jgi:hypothetical protein
MRFDVWLQYVPLGMAYFFLRLYNSREESTAAALDHSNYPTTHT